MKLLTSPLPADRLHELRDTLLREGVNGMTVTRLENRQEGVEAGEGWVKKGHLVQIAILLDEAEVERFLDAILLILQETDISDDARLLVLDVPEAICIRTGENGPDAIR